MFLSETWCENIGADESLLLVLSGVVGVAGVAKWSEMISGKTPGRRLPIRGLLSGAMILGFVCIYFTLRKWSDAEVRDSSCYISILLAWSVAAATLSCLAFSFLGVSFRWDCIAGNNLSAAFSLAGALLGLSFIHCGSNIGRGPSLWNNVFSAILGTLAWLALWFLVERFTRVSLAITEERDLGSGLRLGSFLCAEGLILGRAIAGDWESVSATTVDLVRDGWFGLVLFLPAIALEKRLQPRRGNPFPRWVTHGLGPGMGYLACGGLAVVLLGKWKTLS